jgi:hypothetical protein
MLGLHNAGKTDAVSVSVDRRCGEYSTSHGVAARLHNLNPLLTTDMDPYHAILNTCRSCYARIGDSMNLSAYALDGHSILPVEFLTEAHKQLCAKESRALHEYNL